MTEVRRGSSLLLSLVGGVLLLGAAATWFWVNRVGIVAPLRAHAFGAVVALLGTAALTGVNLGLRWLRWHFLTRRVGIELATRDSLLVYGGTLPAIVTPFFLGELIRPVLLRRRYPGHTGDLVSIWILERSSDLVIVALLLFAVGGSPTFLLIFGSVWLVVLMGVRWASGARRAGGASGVRTFPDAGTTAVVLGATGASWAIVSLALAAILWLLGDPLSAGASMGVFSRATIVGGLSGLPLGTGVTGSSMIVALGDRGIPLDTAAAATLVFRAGTAWFAVAGGVVVALAYRKRLSAIARAPRADPHFDEIAHEYESVIPEHVRDRLLGRKLRVMNLVRGSRVLDVGCGPGWYACELAGQGCEVVGLDASANQIETARANAKSLGVPARFETVPNGAPLPFDDAQFDAAYAINVLHHVLDDDVREGLLREIIRVLKPGGVFTLHEINTVNPAFRLYMGYVFPLIRAIDEGTERWIRPDRLPEVPGASWRPEIDYFTFLPDFLPAPLLRALGGVERALERSRIRSFSAHYAARLEKESLARSGESTRC